MSERFRKLILNNYISQDFEGNIELVIVTKYELQDKGKRTH